eukprot:scaffold651763_cov41-Prasinocladus_malaysianus.AAC.1
MQIGTRIVILELVLAAGGQDFEKGEQGGGAGPAGRRLVAQGHHAVCPAPHQGPGAQGPAAQDHPG